MEQIIDSEYTIKPISNEFGDKAVEFLKEHFIGYDPITQCLLEKVNDKSKLFSPDYKQVIKGIIDQGHCIMAITNAGDIIGLLINEQLGNNTSLSHPKLKLLIGSLHTILNEKAKCDKELLIRIAAVHPMHNRKGIGKSLLLHAIEDSTLKGFEQLRGFCISAYSAKLFESCGFEYIHSIAYEDFKLDGVAVFKPKLPHTHVHGMILRLHK